MLNQPIELKLPAARNMMLVLRLTTAGVVARAGLGVDRMDDVKMAVEEACSCLIGEESAADRLSLSFCVDDSQLLIRICTDCSCAAEADELGVVRCILESLVDSVDMHMQDEKLSGVDLRVALGDVR